MTPIEQAKMVYLNDPECTRVFEEDLGECLRHGYVFSTPRYFVMGYPTKDAWFVWMAVGVGALKQLMQLIPYELPYIVFHRRGNRLRQYSLADFRRKIYGEHHSSGAAAA